MYMFKILYVCGLVFVIYRFFVSTERDAYESISENSFSEDYDLTRIMGELGKFKAPSSSNGTYSKYTKRVSSNICGNKVTHSKNYNQLSNKIEKSFSNDKIIKNKPSNKNGSLNEIDILNEDTLLFEDDMEVDAPNIVKESFESLNNKKTDSFIDRLTNTVEQMEAIALTEIACQQDREKDEREKLNAINPFAPSEEHYNNSGSDWYDNDDYYYDDFYYPY